MSLKVKMVMCLKCRIKLCTTVCAGVYVIAKILRSVACKKLFRVSLVITVKGYQNGAGLKLAVSRRVEDMGHHFKCV